MPKYRQLHTKIIDSFDFNEMPDDFTRVIWLLLTLILDSEGRGIDKPAWIKSKMFPMRPDISEQEIKKTFDWLEKRKMIVRYKKDNHCYFYIPTFKIYQSGTQKEAKSVLPAPELVKSLSGVSPDEVRAAESASASVIASELESVVVKDGRPNIYSVYERELGALTPIIAEELDDIEKTYPEGWFVDALREGKLSSQNVNLKYILAILKRWKAEGKQTKTDSKTLKPFQNSPDGTGVNI